MNECTFEVFLLHATHTRRKCQLKSLFLIPTSAEKNHTSHLHIIQISVAFNNFAFLQSGFTVNAHQYRQQRDIL